MTWILTNSGKHFDFADPQPDQIDILDIAQGLANECRYAGQCRVFYSVAQVIVNSAKVEVDHMRISGGAGSGFIPVQSVDRKQPMLPGDSMTIATQGGSKTITQLPNGATVTRHKMGG